MKTDLSLPEAVCLALKFEEKFNPGALQDLALLLVKGPVLSTPWKMFSMYLNAT